MVRRPPPMPAILIDSNEKAHGYQYSFDGFPTQVANLETGDYSLDGFQDRCGVERKQKSDLWGCVGGGRRRFKDCLQRLGAMQSPAIVVGSSLDEFAVKPDRTCLTPAQAVGSVISWAEEYRIPIFFCPSRAYAERVTLRWLMAFWRHKMRDGMTARQSAPRPTTTAPPGTTSTG